jgi:hypothetical protein
LAAASPGFISQDTRGHDCPGAELAIAHIQATCYEILDARRHNIRRHRSPLYLARSKSMTLRTDGWSPQFVARVAGILLLLSYVGGGFGEYYIPSKIIVSGDAAATAGNIIASDWLFRMGFAGYLVEALCDVGLTLLFYVLLKPAGRELALLAAFLRIVSTAAFASAELF